MSYPSSSITLMLKPDKDTERKRLHGVAKSRTQLSNVHLAFQQESLMNIEAKVLNKIFSRLNPMMHKNN